MNDPKPLSATRIDSGAHKTKALVERLFRHEYGRIVSSLTATFGSQHLALAEEVTQETLLKALRLWPYRGIPERPAAWLRSSARNLAVDHLRREKLQRTHESQIISTLTPPPASEPTTGEPFAQEQLHMMFVCCDPALPTGSRAPLILKTLCGFGSREIAAAFLISVGAIDRRLSRARRILREVNPALHLKRAELQLRLPAVLEALCLLFNEGYYTHTGKRLIREELCFEALRLARLLLDNKDTSTDTVAAFCALLLFHTARLPARTTIDGEPALLASQNRTQWDKKLINEGFHWLEISMRATHPGVYHLQAGIAAEHVSAPSYDATNWPRILEFYDQLRELDSSPVIALNRTVALAKAKGAKNALREMHALIDRPFMRRYHLFWATMGDLQRDTADKNAARDSYARALALAKLEHEKRLLQKKLSAL